MEFHSRKACVDYYSEQYPHLPKYMVEIALDYDLEQSNKKMTGAERRKLKRATKEIVLEDNCVSELKSCGSAQVVTPKEYTMPPMVKGAIEVDGAQLKSEDLS